MKTLPISRYFVAACLLCGIGGAVLFAEHPELLRTLSGGGLVVESSGFEDRKLREGDDFAPGEEGELEREKADEPEPLPPAPVRERVMVVIDAGHGGRDGGAVRSGVLEKTITLSIAKKLEKQLKLRGISSVLTRKDDTHLSLSTRVAEVNRIAPLVVCSIHCNTGPSGARGVEVFYARSVVTKRDKELRRVLELDEETEVIDRRSEKLAGMIVEDLSRDTGLPARSAVARDLAMTAHSVCPAVLVECGYLTHAGERRKLNSDAHQEKVAVSLAETLARVVGGMKNDSRWQVEVISPVPAPGEDAPRSDAISAGAVPQPR